MYTNNLYEGRGYNCTILTLTINAKLRRRRRCDSYFADEIARRRVKNLYKRADCRKRIRAVSFISAVHRVSHSGWRKTKGRKISSKWREFAAMHFVNTLVLSRITPFARISAPVFNY